MRSKRSEGRRQTFSPQFIAGSQRFLCLVCNGLVLAEDGKKMSKRLRNYVLHHSENSLRSRPSSQNAVPESAQGEPARGCFAPGRSPSSSAPRSARSARPSHPQPPGTGSSGCSPPPKLVKTPLFEMVVVHPDRDFLDDISSTLGEYVREELNVRSIVACSDPLKYGCLRAEPDFSVLGKRLGRAMGLVTKEVKGLPQDAILEFQKSGAVTVAGHELTAGDIKVVRDFKPPEGFDKDSIDAAGDGDVLVVLDLRTDKSLQESGFAREIVNRVQKLRKKSGLEPTDTVDVYYELVGDSSSALENIFESQASYIEECVGSHVLPQEKLHSQTVAISSEQFSGVAGGTFKITLAKPVVCS